MNIILCTSPHIKHAAVLESDFQPRNDLMYTFAPLGLLMLCSVLRKKVSITPVIYDINKNINTNEIQNTDTFYQSAALSICKLNPDVVGFMTECDSYHHVLQICQAIKEINPACFVLLGGPHATAVALPTMKKWDCIDGIVLGEGEVSFPALIERLLKSERYIVPGMMMRNEEGTPVEGAKQKLVDTLDELPFPAYDLYTPQEGEELFIEVGRGCPFECTFCSTSPFWQRRHRVKSPNRIIDEIRYIKSLHPCSRFHFTHDLFTANRAWVEAVCRALIEADLGIRWTCSSRVDTISEDLIALMAKAGCNAIFFGIESGSERILELINKKISIKETYNVVEQCHSHKIAPNGGLIVGFPFEDAKSLDDTFSVFHQLIKKGMKPLHIFSYCPFAQSSLYDSLEALECSENFLDIPLPESLDSNNRVLIKSDREIFGSYFRPSLPHLPELKDGVLYAVDEFALLVDAVRTPVVLIADRLGMKGLFLLWVDFIDQLNKEKGRAKNRRFFGSPLEFCQFLNLVSQDKKNQIPEYVNLLISVIQRNLEIAATLSYQAPITMENYRSLNIHRGLTKIRFESTLHVENVLDARQFAYDIIPLLNVTKIETEIPAIRRVNLVWKKESNGTISLLQVNDFIYHIICNTKESTSLQELLDSWLASHGSDESMNYLELFEDLQKASEKELVIIK